MLNPIFKKALDYCILKRFVPTHSSLYEKMIEISNKNFMNTKKYRNEKKETFVKAVKNIDDQLSQELIKQIIENEKLNKKINFCYFDKRENTNDIKLYYEHIEKINENEDYNILTYLHNIIIMMYFFEIEDLKHKEYYKNLIKKELKVYFNEN
jgi:hypothetical protein